jgi:ribosomal protein S18 acetylase RimI-like enzyme
VDGTQRDRSERGPALGTTPPRVRFARRGDAAAWRALQQGIYDEGCWFVGEGPPSETALAARLQHVSRDRAAVWLAEDGARAVGWCEASRLAAERLEHVALLTVAVARGSRGRGVGRALLGEAEAWARRWGLRKLSLHVRSGNAAAIGLYRRLGFELEGVERGQVRHGDAFEDNLIMAKHLVPPETPA